MEKFLIEDRRKRPHIPRTIERRAPDKDDARVIQYLEKLGFKKVQAEFMRGTFNSRYIVAKRWLDQQITSGKPID